MADINVSVRKLVKYGMDKGFFKKADETRRKYVGDEVHLRALIEFSNICKRQCLYCGLRFHDHHRTGYMVCLSDLCSDRRACSGLCRID